MQNTVKPSTKSLNYDIISHPKGGAYMSYLGYQIWLNRGKVIYHKGEKSEKTEVFSSIDLEVAIRCIDALEAPASVYYGDVELKVVPCWMGVALLYKSHKIHLEQRKGTMLYVLNTWCGGTDEYTLQEFSSLVEACQSIEKILY